MDEQRESIWRRTVVAVDQILAPLVVFGATYFAVILAIAPRIRLFQWVALLAAVAATVVSVFLWDRGRWRLGLFVHPRLALREAALGMLFAAAILSTAGLLIVATTGLSHTFRGSFPGLEILAVFLPAVFHEELLFRGYPFQRLWRWKPWPAIIGVSIVFAALHAGNAAASLMGLTNVFLGGVLLSLAYIRYERLWFPTGLHFGWNLMAGPVLGYEVSGYTPAASLLGLEGNGPELLTGGGFGIEGSVWMTVVELVAIVALYRRIRRQKAE
ncbi:MAG TPA: type II CAAX endopeptidase family protein [Thermoanaerobaculia bacterium]|nr:type II CAAX endopeptidase family protein [Thermoanaerobaculia bacterium]